MESQITHEDIGSRISHLKPFLAITYKLGHFTYDLIAMTH